MTENTRHETPDDAELRRLAEAATPGPWGADGLEGTLDSLSTGRRVAEVTMWPEVDAVFIAAASPAVVQGLLDDTDALRAELAHMTEARDNARAEVERLTAAVECVRELHERESFWQYDRDQEGSYPTQQDAANDSGCDCPYAPEPSADLAHTPECLATITHFDVCAECARIEYADAERQAHGDFSGYAESLWPCPTIRALGATPTGGES